MTQDEQLVRMANQIGTFFESMPDHQEALEGIAMHLKKFWDPRMREALLALVDAEGTPPISAMVRESVHTHRALIQ